MYTISPGWVMAAVWAVFWVCAAVWFEDIPEEPLSKPEVIPLDDLASAEPIPPATTISSTITITTRITPTPLAQASPVNIPAQIGMSIPQWGVSFTMCWFAMTCFFILGAWESNLPVFGASTTALHWSPFAAGNFVALGGAACFPFLLLNLWAAPRTQDRHILALGSGVGTTGLLIALALLKSEKVVYGSLFVCWWAVALGFNMASTVTVSLLSKQLPVSTSLLRSV
jgi:hypothetical protein